MLHVHDVLPAVFTFNALYGHHPACIKPSLLDNANNHGSAESSGVLLRLGRSTFHKVNVSLMPRAPLAEGAVQTYTVRQERSRFKCWPLAILVSRHHPIRTHVCLRRQYRRGIRNLLNALNLP